MMIKKNKFFKVKNTFVLFLLILGLQIFDLSLINETVANSFNLISISIVIFYLILKRKIIYENNFNLLILIFFSGLIINFFVMIYSGVSFYRSSFVLINYLGFLFYYFLHSKVVDYHDLIKIGFLITTVIVIFMILQQIFTESVLFNQLLIHDNFIGQRNTVRVRIPGMAFLIFVYFYLLTQFVKHPNFKNLIILLLLLIIVTLQGFRSITASILIISIYIYWKSSGGISNIKFKRIILIPLALIMLSTTIYNSEYLSGIIIFMVATTDINSFAIEETMRYFSWNYYMIDIKEDFWMYLTGNGLKLANDAPQGLFAVDLGIFGFFALAGLLPSISLVFIFVYGIYKNYRKNNFALIGFFLYMLFNAFLFNAEVLRTGVFYIFGIMMYLTDKMPEINK